MAILNLTYTNTAHGKEVAIQFNDVTMAVVSGVLGGPSSNPQPAIICEIPNFAGSRVLVVPKNDSPYAKVVLLPVADCGSVITSIDKVDTSSDISEDGSLVVHVDISGAALPIQYSIDGINFVNTNTFSGLAPGVYTVTIIKTRLGSPGLFEPYYVSCQETQEVVIGFTSVAVCDLQILGVSFNNDSITVNDIVARYPVEYRIDAGAWQDSPVFSGLSNGDYDVLVRYKSDHACGDTVEVNLNGSTCDLVIDLIEVSHETSKYADDGMIIIHATTTSDPIEYSIDNGVTYQEGNAFVGLAPGEYSVRVRDDNGCIANRIVTVRKYKRPVLIFPIVNSYRVIITSGPMLPSVRKQNFDNTLFADMVFPGIDDNCYDQRSEVADIVTEQWRSNYSFQQVKIYNKQGVLQSTLTPVKRSQNIDFTETLNAFFANAGANQTQVFFENGLPLFFEVGQDIAISGEPTVNGTYEVKDIRAGIGVASGYQVLIIDKVYTAPGVTDGSVQITYDLEPYEVYEVVFNWSTLGAGDYYLIFEGSDQQFAPYVAESEPISVKTSWTDTVQMKYRSYDNSKVIDYSTGIMHLIRVPGEVKIPTNSAERTVYEDSNDRLVKIESYVRRNPELANFELPYYLLEKIALALDSDFCELDGVEYQTTEDYKPVYFPNDALGNGSGILRQVDFNGENGTDTGGPDVDILGTDETLLGAP